MANPDKRAVVEKVRRAPYATLFERIYGKGALDDVEPAYERIVGAIAAFERSAELQPFSSKYDAWLAGKAQLTGQELRGLKLYEDEKKGNCAACHPSQRGPKGEAPLFTDFTYDNLGVPRNVRIPANADPAFFDLGLCGPKRTAPGEDSTLCGAFKVPTLRNVTKRVALMHNGFFTQLRDAVDFYATRDTHPTRWYPGGAPFDDLPPEYHANVNRTEAPYDRNPGEAPRLDDADIDAIVAFLGTLADGYGAPLAAAVQPKAPRRPGAAGPLR
jgi:cytochrome c peroxidase